MHRQVQHHSGVATAGSREEKASWRPADDAPALHIARADDHIGTDVHRIEETEELLGFVRSVRVHLDRDVVSCRGRDVEAVDIRTGQTATRGATEHVDAAELRPELLGLCRGAVGARVVDDEDVGTRACDAQSAEQRFDVVGFLVRGNDDEDPKVRLVGPAFVGTAKARARRGRVRSDAARDRSDPARVRRPPRTRRVASPIGGVMRGWRATTARVRARIRSRRRPTRPRGRSRHDCGAPGRQSRSSTRDIRGARTAARWSTRRARRRLQAPGCR